MRALRRIGKVAAWCVAVVAVLALVVAGLRAYNANKYPIAQMEASGGASAAEYPQSDHVRKISGD